MEINKELLTTYYEQIKFLFKNIISIRKHLDIVFVFGGTSDDNNRDKFKKYVLSNNQTPFDFITIESLYKDITKYSSANRGISSKTIDLAKLELTAIEKAYSVLLFPESPGSFAELGFFSANPTTREKILIMNDLDFSQDESYVNELIKLIHEGRQIDPFYFTNDTIDRQFNIYLGKLMQGYDNAEEYFNDIYDDNIKGIKNNEMFPLSIIYTVIKIIPYLTFTELESICIMLFKEHKIDIQNKRKYMTSMVSLLVVSDLIQRVEIQAKKLFIVSEKNMDLLQFEVGEKEQILLMKITMDIKEKKGI